MMYDLAVRFIHHMNSVFFIVYYFRFLMDYRLDLFTHNLPLDVGISYNFAYVYYCFNCYFSAFLLSFGAGVANEHTEHIHTHTHTHTQITDLGVHGHPYTHKHTYTLTHTHTHTSYTYAVYDFDFIISDSWIVFFETGTLTGAVTGTLNSILYIDYVITF